MKKEITFNLASVGTQATQLLQAGKPDSAAALLERHLAGQPDDAEAWYQLSRVEIQPERRKYEQGLQAIETALQLRPAKPIYLAQRGFVLMHLKRFPESIAILEPLLEQKPEDYFRLNALHMAYERSGDLQQAVALGARILRLEDHSATALPIAAPRPTDGGARGERRIISYSLWGTRHEYTHGAVVNARLAPFFYPGWQCRFYVRDDVPAAVLQSLQSAGAQVIDASTVFPQEPPSLWRFLPADDPEVALFMCRDCDSRPTVKEAAAVNAWLSSGKRGHVMRDHAAHRVVMLAGLWGARTTPPLFMQARIKRFLETLRSGAGGYGGDQFFLAREIWPEIRADCLQHDSYYDLPNAQRFPIMGKGDNRFHVGMSITDTAALAREARLLQLAPQPFG